MWKQGERAHLIFFFLLVPTVDECGIVPIDLLHQIHKHLVLVVIELALFACHVQCDLVVTDSVVCSKETRHLHSNGHGGIKYRVAS